MAAGTYAYPGATNTYVKNHEATGNLVVSFSRNPSDFPLARYVQYREVKKDAGYYLRIAAEQAARIVGSSLSEFVWPDGADRPRRNNGTEKFRFEDYRTERYDYDFQLGYKAESQADWNIRDTEADFKAQQAMTGRTVKVQNMLGNTANWDSSHRSAVASIPGNLGTWELSTTARSDIKRSLNYAANLIRQHTLGVVKRKDLILVVSPTTAAKIGESQEIIDYLKGSPDALKGLTGALADKYDELGMPAKLYGIEVVVEDTVVVTSARGAATPTYADAMTEGRAFLLARPGGLVSKAGNGPSFATAMLFLLEEMTVESRDDKDNRRIEGHVVDDYAEAMPAPVSGFYFEDVIE